ncbi:DUF3387 domain-containing protein [Halioglobus maricola]|uniref:DUF3387 domain-containing protein n=1 Tax=Halioglobus maricola TaxID=2601894 RepID=A0A5P9NJC0_9GAMM|nr:type I restriction enzyme endonuclease domain-containing protein [Halioglobus maricola]QFU75931.1 DUF3387 domain-containing protein [Halioglobus maricola]
MEQKIEDIRYIARSILGRSDDETERWLFSPCPELGSRIPAIECQYLEGEMAVLRWLARTAKLEKEITGCNDTQEELDLLRKLDWMRQTLAAVVVSEEQGEVEKFAKWNLDIKPHRQLIKQGFETTDGKRIDMESAFKSEEHPFRVAIVCAMWLTGFDVPSLSTLYLDKPLKAHTLMQAIARANRVYEGKNNGLIVDYCGILKNLRKALATFAGYKGEGDDTTDPPPGSDPTKPKEELLADLEEAIESVRGYLEHRSFRLEDVLEKTGFERNKAIIDAKEAINESDETRKRFEIICREVFKKFKAGLSIKGVNDYRHAYDAIHIIYKSLKDDVDKADISDIMQALHKIVEECIEPKEVRDAKTSKLYDISQIDFDRLRREFERSPARNTTVHSLKEIIEKKLLIMLMQNPTRMDFQRRYEEIVDEYNNEKDRVTIEQTFEALLILAVGLSEEEKRAVKEGLNEKSLALFDLLLKPELEKREIERIKKVAEGLYRTLKEELARLHNFTERQGARDQIKVKIKDFLWDDKTGLPGSFAPEEVDEKTEAVFQHLVLSARNETTRSAFEL